MVEYQLKNVNIITMRIGAHISAAGGLWNAPLNATKLGLECFQFFSRPPQGGRISPIAEDVAEKFISACKKHGLTDHYIHAPYIVNLASKEARIRNNTIEIIRGELERGTILKAKAMMTHLGSASSIGDPEKGVRLTIEGIKKILDGYRGTTQLLLEISAGAGMVMGAKFEEMAEILEGVGDDSVGICFDTAHAFASGYDLRTQEAVRKTMKTFDDTIGLDRLVCVHFNDSKIDIGDKKDRHEHLGEGFIGKEGMTAIIRHKAFEKMDLLLETPHDGTLETLGADITFMRKVRG